MTISWYPGHMFKANKELAKLIEQVDVVIEVLDARMPAASSNPLLHKMRRQHHKPCLHILNKADLANPDATRVWIKHLTRAGESSALPNGTGQLLLPATIVTHCQRLAHQQKRRYSAAIVGIPNVGKSTLLNQISGRKLAKTGNEPAVTKNQQRIKLNEQWFLFDTPGVLWPRLEDQAAAYRLAAAGAIRNTAIVFEDVAMEAAEFLLRDFPAALIDRYRIEPLPKTAEAFLSTLAERRACRNQRGDTDWHRVSEILLHDFREGKLGRLTLELPPENMVDGALTSGAPQGTPDTHA